VGRFFLNIIGFIYRIFSKDLKNDSKEETFADHKENIDVALLFLARIGVIVILTIVITKIVQSL